MQNDIVADILQQLSEKLGAEVCTPDVMKNIESSIRKDWGGCEVYVKGLPKKTRDMNIRADYRNGLGLRALSARYEITVRRVRQVLIVRER